MSAQRLRLLLKALLVLAALAVSGGPLVRQFQDPDFFWHLKSGEWIVEHRALPGEFIFASNPPATLSVHERFTLTSYWLAQALFHLAHAAGGLAAIVVLRFLLWALLALALWSGKDGDDLVFLGLLVPAAVILARFSVERPQYCSFVFFGFLLALLRGIGAAGPGAALSARGAAVPVLMIVWANCHGGYVVGLGIMAAWLLAESLKRLHPRLEPLPRERYRLLVGSVAAGFLASLLNPNTYHVFSIILQPSWGPATIVEYLSTLEAYRVSSGPWILVYWSLLGLAVAGLALSWRTPDLTSIALVALTGYYSFTRVRFVPFFVVAALFVLSRQLSAPRVVRVSRFALAAAGLVVGMFFLRDAVKTWRNAPRCAEVSEFHFPVEAANLIRSEGLQGNLFNFYAWGGYLIWRLSPANVFIDGRNSDRERFEDYRRIMIGEGGAGADGRPFWKTLFQRHGVRSTVTPIFEPLSGEVFGLLDDLAADPAWVPVYLSPTTVVFAEDVPANRAAIRRNALPKARFFQDLYDCCAAIIAVNPAFVPAYVARGDVLLRLGDRAGALRSYEEALRRAPDHASARARVAQLLARAGQEPAGRTGR